MRKESSVRRYNRPRPIRLQSVGWTHRRLQRVLISSHQTWFGRWRALESSPWLPSLKKKSKWRNRRTPSTASLDLKSTQRSKLTQAERPLASHISSSRRSNGQISSLTSSATWLRSSVGSTWVRSCRIELAKSKMKTSKWSFRTRSSKRKKSHHLASNQTKRP